MKVILEQRLEIVRELGFQVSVGQFADQTNSRKVEAHKVCGSSRVSEENSGPR